jgi:hypothetical protein
MRGLDTTSAQGTGVFLRFLFHWGPMERAGPLRRPTERTEIDASHCPGFGPALAAAACFAEGVTLITGARRPTDGVTANRHTWPRRSQDLAVT